MMLNVPISEDFQLRDLEVSDAFSLSEMIVSNRDYLKLYMPKTTADNLSEAKSSIYILKKVEQHLLKSQFTFGLVETSENKIIGLIILKNIDHEKKKAEFAYCLSKNYGRKGLVSKAVNRTLQFAKEDLGLENFIIITHKSNKTSVGVALNNNFEWTKTLFNEFTPTGKAPVDMELYELKPELE